MVVVIDGTHNDAAPLAPFLMQSAAGVHQVRGTPSERCRFHGPGSSKIVWQAVTWAAQRVWVKPSLREEFHRYPAIAAGNDRSRQRSAKLSLNSST